MKKSETTDTDNVRHSTLARHIVEALHHAFNSGEMEVAEHLIDALRALENASSSEPLAGEAPAPKRRPRADERH